MNIIIDKMNKYVLIENLRKICLDTKPLTANSFREHKHSKIWMRQGITVFLNQEDLKYYYNILKEVTIEPNIKTRKFFFKKHRKK